MIKSEQSENALERVGTINQSHVKLSVSSRTCSSRGRSVYPATAATMAKVAAVVVVVDEEA